jgi:amino acid transporter
VEHPTVNANIDSVDQAAQGGDESLDDKDDPEVRSQYDRNSPGYPYKSSLQYLRACYALLGCFLLAFFNGWRALTHPYSSGDFLGCYISVSLTIPSNIFLQILISNQILIFAVFVAAYQIKFHGYNPANWRRRVSRELQNPRPLVVKNELRRGRLNLVDTYHLFTVGNLKALGEWVWVWLK